MSGLHVPHLRNRLSVEDQSSPDEAKYENGALVQLPYPTNDVRLLTKFATDAVTRIYRPGFRYSKAEVLLMDICQPGEFTDDLFSAAQPLNSDRLMAALDMINDKWGRGTLRTGSVPVTPDWGMRRDQMSQSFTTRLDQLWVVKAK
ncbi:DUF4113 domain-containing protein [Pseudomonas syringae pv. actinidiae]|nr:RulB protein [Pseudomonas syringae pv. actinidiae]AYL84397.1 DUF4113 domain-containing protein [Pseudomonas syringae pv. actinidiae str. Shaanxi_M228]MCQ4651910.1 DUF4113 domain-containing protein [Pseudomonas syringae]AQX68483.1 RulB protein [Pseudomonas syringae pv. actinidiae]AYL13203.1 DUF4113 domain-containing protein [Pseudomonas syringae pv. actinidiae]